MAKTFLELVNCDAPIPIVGTINAYCARLAEHVGHKALYLSGAGVANASFGMPDLAMTHLGDVLEDARRITQVTDCPLMVDIDTGWGHALTISRAIKSLAQVGVKAVHIEDQVFAKRCGHRPNKAIVSKNEMVDRVKAAVDAAAGYDICIFARTDAFAVEGMASALDRASACIEAGADAIFPEAMESLDDYQAFTQNLNVPVLANITEFGKTPLFTQEALHGVGIDFVLYPLSAFRMMSQAALRTYEALLQEGSQVSLIDEMQTRHALYEHLGYHQFEKIIDSLNDKGEAK